MEIKSPAFKEGALIPAKYTCDSIDVSPPLEWSQGPSGTKTYAIICDDPDAPMVTYVHWVLFNIPSDINQLAENQPKTTHLKNGGIQGKNHFGKTGYGGPCPPGGTHRYYFKLYAIDRVLAAESVITKEDLLKAIAGNVLAECQLMGRYKRT